MSAGRIIAYIGAAITILFGVLFIWAAFGTQFNSGWLITGLISVGIGFGLIWFAGRLKPSPESSQNVTLNIELPANVDLDEFTCQNCGGNVSPDDVTMVAGAPILTCPFCGTTYQLKEDPRW